MFHGLLWFVFSVENGKFGEHSHMRPFETKASFHQRNQLIKKSIVFILLNQLLQLFGMDNQIETTDLSKSEFSLVDTGLIDVFPYFGRVRLTCTVDRILVFAEMDQCRCQPSPVGNTCEEDFSCLIQFLVVTFLADIQDLQLVM